jgi:peptide/nickel transport system permease protein
MDAARRRDGLGAPHVVSSVIPTHNSWYTKAERGMNTYPALPAHCFEKVRLVIQYLISRLLQALLVIIGVLLVVFMLLQLTGDPARLMLGLDASEEDVNRMRELLGLNEPLHIQFIKFLGGALQGDFGESLRFSGQPALSIVLERFPATLQLGITALTLAISLALILGIVAAVKRHSIFDNIAMFIALLGQSMPSFWLGLMLITLFAVTWGILPSMGRGEGFRYVILPALTLAATPLARTTRLVRSCMLDVLGEDYVRTARMKGLNERTIVIRHALKNAAIPVVTVVGLDVGFILGGALIIEQVFGWPGVGKLALDSVFARDFPVVQASVFFLATSLVLINLFVDILYTWLDPRVRLD